MIKDIKAYQGYVSYSMKKFPFLKRFNLKSYYDKSAPLVVFGCYGSGNVNIILNHKGIVIIRWCGADSRKKYVTKLIKPNIIHVAILPNIQRYLKSKGINCHQIKASTREKPYPMILKDKVYTYLNKNAPQYHGSEIVKRLNIKYKILIGDYSIPQKDWYAGRCNEYYSQAFIGLSLSNYAGGAGSIIEMGLRGIKVVTNLLDMPHTIPWKTIKDIEQSIEKESQNIGKINKKLADQVYNSMNHDPDCFDLDKLLI